MALRTFRQRIRLACVLLVVFAGLAYAGTLVSRSWKAYAGVTEGRGWTGRVYESDPELGFRMVPGARGAETFTLGPDVAARVDSDGFRVPLDAPDRAPRARPLVLALGCSFTYGAACLAEETYAAQVAEKLHGSCVNAGVCSYGLAQMLLLARKLIPLYEPDYVLFQHSPWLVSRGRSRYASTYLGLVPTPTFVEQDGASVLRPPLFAPIVFDLPAERYAATQRGFLGFLSFQWHVGWPLFVHDDVQRARVGLTQRADTLTGEAQIVERVHAEVEALCAQHRARLVYVLIGSGCPASPVPEAIQNSGAAIADASGALCATLGDVHDKNYMEQCKLYLARYGHWAGEPPELVDVHPNAAAHSVIAECILAAIRAAK